MNFDFRKWEGCLLILSAVFKHAKRLGFIDGVNPVQDVSIPKKVRGKKVRGKKKTHAYSLHEVEQFLNVLDERSACIVAVAAFAGLRRSEIHGLRWQDYDASILRIERSIWEGIAGDPKTDASADLVPVIEALAERVASYRSSLTAEPKPNDPMFAATNGKPLRLNNALRSQILPSLTVAGLKCHGWHAFRRGLATILHDLGIDDLTIQAILRHSDVKVTQQSYIKTLPKQSIAAMKALNAELLKKRSKNGVVDSKVPIN
jgi:integrase